MKRAILTLSVLAAALPVAAQKSPGEDLVRSPILKSLRRPPDPEAGRHIEWIDDTRQHIRGFVENVGRTIDGWFGDIPFEQGGRLVNGRLGLNLLWRRDEGIQTGLRFRGKFELPNLKNKAYLYFGQDNERELVTDQPDEFSRQRRLLSEQRDEDQTFFAGLGYTIRENIDLRAGIRGGIKPYVQARFNRDWMLASADKLTFRETLFWEVSEGLGLTTALNYEHVFTHTLALRWRNAATLSQSTDALAWQTSLGTYFDLGGPRQLSFEALASGETGSPVKVGEYGLRGTYRQAVYLDWLLGELIVGHFWPRDPEDTERGRSWAVGVGLEVLF